MKIVLVTTGQPSCNPRIVKEADSLQQAGYDVTVLYSFFISWAEEKDTVLLKKVMWKYKMVGGSENINKLSFFLTRVYFKVNFLLNKYIGNNYLIAERAQARAFDKLLNEAKKIKADWYIGHNLGSLPIVVKAAKYNNAKAGFDFEDYHRGEGQNASTLKRIIFLENKYVPSLKYFSTASALITAAIKNDHRKFCGKVITLLNCFPLTQQPVFTPKRDDDETLQLFWFSQTIGINRGLEVLITSLNYLNDNSIHLTLVGRCNADMTNYIKKYSRLLNNIHFAGIIQPEELPTFSSKYDIGLATETGFSENNDIALSNKIFTYLLAGNAIILSKTSMQNQFNTIFQVGASFEINNIKQFSNSILLYKNKIDLNTQKLHNYQLARTTLNWENESNKLLEILK